MAVGQLEQLLREPIRLLDDCGFCDLGQKKVGDKDDRGAIKIYGTGKNPGVDWYATLQDTVTSNPETGFRILHLPVGHLKAFVQRISNIELVLNHGISSAVLSYAMQKVREEDAKRLGRKYIPMERIDGKCFAKANSKAHIHFKYDEPSGGLAQPFPCDTGPWTKNTQLAFFDQKRGMYVDVTRSAKGSFPQAQRVVAAEPIQQHTHPSERMDYLAERLIQYCGEAHERLLGSS